MDLRGFVKDLMTDYIEGEHLDIPGDAVQDLMVAHGLAVHREITEAECEEPWAREWGYEPGDMFYAYTDELKTLLWPKSWDQGEKG